MRAGIPSRPLSVAILLVLGPLAASSPAGAEVDHNGLILRNLAEGAHCRLPVTFEGRLPVTFEGNGAPVVTADLHIVIRRYVDRKESIVIPLEAIRN